MTMESPTWHEGNAKSAAEDGDIPRVQAYAILALASAVEQLARAYENAHR
jgi:hypothetical protein